MSSPRITIAGAGLIGMSLAHLAHQHHWKVRILHRTSQPNNFVWTGKDGYEHAEWNPAQRNLPASAIQHSNVVACFSGAPIAPHPWTKKYQKILIDSRLNTTHTITQTILTLPTNARPHTFLCANAAGYYGNRADELLTETAPPGQGFIADLCQAWQEAATGNMQLSQTNVRILLSRTGIVVSKHQGLAPILSHIYRFGLGMQIGNGKQWQPFVSLADAVSALWHAINTPSLTGAINICSSQQFTNLELHQFLAENSLSLKSAKLSSRILRLGGKQTTELLLASTRMIPQKILDSGFLFKYPNLTDMWKVFI